MTRVKVFEELKEKKKKKQRNSNIFVRLIIKCNFIRSKIHHAKQSFMKKLNNNKLGENY